MAVDSATITLEEKLLLPSLGIDRQFITSANVTMGSDKYICVRETPIDKDQKLVIIDTNNSADMIRKPIKADSALMNPNSRILAWKVQAIFTSQDHLQIFNFEQGVKVKSYQMPEQVVFWKWITPKMLGLVTQSSVYHWSLGGDSKPVFMFKRAANLKDNLIINYQCDPNEKWLFLIGISSGEDKMLRFVKGNMQLFSVEQQQSEVFEAHAAAFASFKVAGNENPSILLSFASKTMSGGHLTLKLDVIELDAKQGKRVFTKKQANMLFPLAFADDYPVSMHISHNSGLMFIHVITRWGILFVYNLEKAAAVCTKQICPDGIILTCDVSTVGEFIAVNCKGQVLLVIVNEATIAPYFRRQIMDNDLTSNIYIKARATANVGATFAKKREFDKQDWTQVVARKERKGAGGRREKARVEGRDKAGVSGAGGCRDVEEEKQVARGKQQGKVGEGVMDRSQGHWDALEAARDKLKVERGKLKAKLEGVDIQLQRAQRDVDWAMQEQNIVTEALEGLQRAQGDVDRVTQERNIVTERPGTERIVQALGEFTSARRDTTLVLVRILGEYTNEWRNTTEALMPLLVELRSVHRDTAQSLHEVGLHRPLEFTVPAKQSTQGQESQPQFTQVQEWQPQFTHVQERQPQFTQDRSQGQESRPQFTQVQEWQPQFTHVQECQPQFTQDGSPQFTQVRSVPLVAMGASCMPPPL